MISHGLRCLCSHNVLGIQYAATTNSEVTDISPKGFALETRLNPRPKNLAAQSLLKMGKEVLD